VTVLRGEEVLEGEIHLGDESVCIPEVDDVLHKMKRSLKSMPIQCRYDELPNEAPIKNVWRIICISSEFIQGELINSEDVIEEMSQYGMTAWVDSAPENTYFEMKVSADHLPQVELLAANIYFGTIKLNLIFTQGAYYCTLSEALSEQPLFDEVFPNISSRGSGFQVQVYNNDETWQKLTLWQLLDEHALNLNNVLRDKKSEAKSEEKSSGGEQVEEATVLNDDELWEKAQDAYGGSYTQTYLMLKPQSKDSISRRALFRYGNWCYGGSLDMDMEVTLAEVPHVLRKFQRQQGRLGYMCEIKSLPDNLPFSSPMKHFAMASAFLETEIVKAEQALSDLTEYHRENGIRPWVDEENGCQYFELSTADGAEHYEDVELMASKTYCKGVVVITIYFQGSLFVTLSPSIDDQPLLDMSFPDVASKGRGIHVSSYIHREFKKLMLWQSQRSVWETANRAVMEQRRQEALKRNLLKQAEIEEEADEEDEVHEAPPEEEEVSIVEEFRGADETKSESKIPDKVLKDEPTHIAPALQRSSMEQKSSSNVRAPHHLKPLGGEGSLRSLPKLNNKLSMDAPWDSLGRPKNIFAKK